LGKSLGTGMREFKDSITGKDGDDRADETPAVPEQATLSRAEEPTRENEPAAPASERHS
jgi:Sec-independent protein translocase protein TatA